MDYIIEKIDERLLLIDKEIFRIHENEWKMNFLNIVCNDIHNLNKYLLGLANSIKLEHYTCIESLYASIIVNSKKNKNKIAFDEELVYSKIVEILNKEKEELVNDLKRVDELRKTSLDYKTVALELKYNKNISSKTIDFIMSNFDDIPNDKKVKLLNELDYYGKEKKEKINTLVFDQNFNLEIVPRYDEINSNKRKLIYSYAPNMFRTIKNNDFNDIENILCDSFDNYDFNDQEKAMFTSLLLEIIYNEIKDYKEIFLNDNFFVDKESSIEITEVVQNLLNAYNKILGMYKGYVISEEIGDKRELNFGYICNRPDKARAFEDIESYIDSNDMDLTQTRYAHNLLDGFINKDPKVIFESIVGSDGYFKIKLRGTNKGTGAGRLRKPRFVLKKENGKLIIVGFFLKNNQAGNRDYNSMENRTFVLNPDADNKTIEQIFSILESKLSKNK